MKLFKGILALSLLMMFTLVSCNKDDDDDSSSSSAKMTATIDKASWTAFTRVSTMADEIITITGTSTSGEVLSIMIYGTTEGTYKLSADLTSGVSTKCGCSFYNLPISVATTYGSTVGTVNLTDVDTATKTISGTFSFTVVNTSLGTKTISNGVFNNLSYTVVPAAN